MLFTVMLAALGEDERSLAELIYIKYKRQIYKIAYSVLNNHHDAEDVLNDVMLNVINNIEKFVDSDGNKTAAQIVIYSRNAAINRYNKNKRKSEAESSVSYMDEDGTLNHIEIPDREYDLEDMILRDETSAIVRKYLLQLPQEYRDAISLVYGYGYSNKDAAGILKITPNALTLRLFKAKKKLMELAGGELYERI